MSFAIEILGADRVVARLESIDARLAAPPEPLFRSISEEWTAWFRDNLAQQTEVGGAAFASLSPATRRQRTRQGYGASAPILQRKGYLRSSIILLEASSEQLRVGSALNKAGLLQFGGMTSPRSAMPNRPIPPRPFLGLNPDQVDETIELVELYYSDEAADA